MATNELTFTSMVNDLSLYTLEEISIVTLAMQLMKDEKIKKIYYQYFSGDNIGLSMPQWMVCEVTSLCEKSLQLPDVFQTNLVSILYWIMDQCFDWIHFVTGFLPKLENEFENTTDYIVHIMNSIKWNKGAIDREKSIHQVFLLKNVKDHEILMQMFRVASLFCLEDDLKMLCKKLPHAKTYEAYMDESLRIRVFPLYWICKARGDMKEFMEKARDLLIDNQCYEAVPDNTDPSNYALVLSVFEGEISGVKYFIKLANLDIKHILHITKIFLEIVKCESYIYLLDWDFILGSQDVLHVLLKEIEDESVLKEIFHEFFEVFLLLSVKSWPWRKFFFPLLKIFVDKIDQNLFYDLITQFLEDVKMKRADVFEIKMLWKIIPDKVKKSFCLYVSNKKGLRDVKHFWKSVTCEVFDLLLEGEELRNILTPHDNYGITACILTGRYDLIEIWLQKCLVSEEAIIPFLENFIQTKSVKIIKIFRRCLLSRMNQFLDWAFKYEDLMNRDEIIKIKDKLISENIIRMFVYGFHYKKWEDLKKLIDWMVRNRNHEYDNELIKWKKIAIENFFSQQSTLRTFHSSDFLNSLFVFFSYGVNDSKKVKIMISRVNLNDGKCCSEHLNGDFDLIDNYLKILEDCGKDMYLTKKNIFNHIFNKFNETRFREEKYCENLKKLLYWNCESDEMKTKVEKIKKAIIKKHAYLNVIPCLFSYSSNANIWKNSKHISKQEIAMNNILNFLFEGNLDNEEWQKMLFDLKIEVMEGPQIWKYVGNKNDYYYYMMVILINWGKENVEIRKQNWFIKKCFIEFLKNNIQAKIIPELILEWNFLPFFLEGDETRTDFDKRLWDFKQFLVKKVISNDDYVLSCKLLENLENFSDFLKWNGFDEGNMQDLKLKILDEKGARCCLFWIESDKLNIAKKFVNWCVSKNSYLDFKTNILKLKINVLDFVVSNYSKHWEEKYFERLDKFLSWFSDLDEED